MTYDFRCSACGHTFEKQLAIGARRPRKCPECGKQTLSQVFSVPAFHPRYSPANPRANRGRGY